MRMTEAGITQDDPKSQNYKTVSTESVASDAHTHSDIIFPAGMPKFNSETAFANSSHQSIVIKKPSNRCFGLCSFNKIKSTGITILISDSIHNFADGIAIGASFAQSPSLGLSTTIAVFCHELPHEFGDYAILIKSGFTHIQALLFNLLSACTCIIGFYVGASVATSELVSQYIFSITAGMFLYIALVEIVSIINFKLFMLLIDFFLSFFKKIN
jgi:zinc transporter ZupT